MLLLITGPPGTGKSTLAEAAATRLGGAAVLAWDWAMAGLTPFGEVQAALRAMDAARHRRVGWSVLGNLAVAQLRAGRSAVLDGCARAPDVDQARRLAATEGVPCRVVATHCRDADLHRRRIEGRTRGIPGWHELDWDHVAGFLSHWEEPPGADLRVDATDPLPHNLTQLATLLAAP